MTWQFYAFYIAPGIALLIAFIVGLVVPGLWWLAAVGLLGLLLWIIVMWPIFERLSSDV